MGASTSVPREEVTEKRVVVPEQILAGERADTVVTRQREGTRVVAPEQRRAEERADTVATRQREGRRVVAPEQRREEELQLQPFLLPNVHPTGRQIGVGSYGSVQEFEVNGLLCAGKKLHDVFFEERLGGGERIQEKFVQECSLLAVLRHPNIVQFLGIFVDNSDIPVLLMEYLPFNLDSVLKGALGQEVEISLAMKCSILFDVSLGLNYLHTLHPPVIHRDITDGNILLSSGMVAKISDLGVARLVDRQLGASLTQVS